MEETLDEALDCLERVIEESGAIITHDPLPIVQADRGQVVRLFQNLIANAIKFRGDRQPEIHVSARKEDGRYVFSVADNGIGIEKKYWGQVFMIFQRLHSRTEYPGTGIGLAVCKKIVERHGGRIWIESKPDQGSTFYFTL